MKNPFSKQNKAISAKIFPENQTMDWKMSKEK